MSVKKKRKGGSKKKGKRGATRGSSAMRGAARRLLSGIHLGIDLPTYPAARAVAFRMKKELGLEKVPAIRKVPQKKSGKETVVYAVVTPLLKPTSKNVEKMVSALKKGKKGKR
jgi:hypothetical protein